MQTLYKMKIQNSLFKIYEEFQDGNHRALNQLWGPSEHRAPSDHTRYTPRKLALVLTVILLFAIKLTTVTF